MQLEHQIQWIAVFVLFVAGLLFVAAVRALDD